MSLALLLLLGGGKRDFPQAAQVGNGGVRVLSFQQLATGVRGAYKLRFRQHRGRMRLDDDHLSRQLTWKVVAECMHLQVTRHNVLVRRKQVISTLWFSSPLARNVGSKYVSRVHAQKIPDGELQQRYNRHNLNFATHDVFT